MIVRYSLASIPTNIWTAYCFLQMDVFGIDGASPVCENEYVYCVTYKDTVVCAASIKEHPDREIFIFNFGTLKKYRGKGYGTKLLSNILDDYNDYRLATLHVESDNKEAIKLYKQFKFSAEFKGEYTYHNLSMVLRDKMYTSYQLPMTLKLPGYYPTIGVEVNSSSEIVKIHKNAPCLNSVKLKLNDTILGINGKAFNKSLHKALPSTPKDVTLTILREGNEMNVVVTCI